MGRGVVVGNTYSLRVVVKVKQRKVKQIPSSGGEVSI